jgi:hypothetical protein
MTTAATRKSAVPAASFIQTTNETATTYTYQYQYGSLDPSAYAGASKITFQALLFNLGATTGAVYARLAYMDRSSIKTSIAASEIVSSSLVQFTGETVVSADITGLLPDDQTLLWMLEVKAGASGVGATVIDPKIMVHFDDVVIPITLGTWAAERGPLYVGGHRGSGDVYPEHSMPAYQATFDAGAQFMEVSVVQSSDGILYCNHDSTFNRMQSPATGNVNAQTGAYIDANIAVNASWLGSYWSTNKPAMPKFEDVLRTFGGRIILACEAKDNNAYPEMIRLIENYGLKDSVLIKCHYASTRISTAKTAGYRIFVYFGAESEITSPNIATVAAACDNKDYFVIPTYGATQATLVSDGNVSACVANSSSIPVWCYYTHRRADRDHMAGLGVVGFVAAEYAYLAKDQAATDAPAWTDGKIPAGDIVLDPTTATYAVTWPGDGTVVFPALSAKHYMLVGEVCPVPAVARDTTGATYSIEYDVAFSTLPASDNTLHADIAFGHADDFYYEFQSAANKTAGYHFIWRANGQFGLYTHIAGSSTGTALVTGTGSAAVAGTYVHVKIDVTPSGITCTLTDGGGAHVITSADTTYRGGYIHIGQNATDSTAVVKFKNLTVA